MAAFSGKKYPTYKIRDPPTDNFSHESAEVGTNFVGNPRSVGKKHLPVRISTAFFEDHLSSKKPGSSRKTIGLSSRKPIRNIHKLLESPKRTARKRLDNLYDYSKPKENFNPSTIKAQALSAKKIAPKTPILTVTPAKKPDRNTSLNKNGQNSRQSRLLPPGTITGTYVNGRNSLAPRTLLSKASNNRLTLAPKIPQAKRPSDVPEESPQPLELSCEEAEKLPLLKSTAKKSMEGLKGVDSNGLINIHKETSPLSDPKDGNERLVYCCKCSKTINDINTSENNTALADTGFKIQVNSQDVIDKNLPSDENKSQRVFERPTVIVMQSEAGLQRKNSDFDELVEVPAVQDGSYSEILYPRPSANSSRIDDTLLFKRTESACAQMEKDKELNGRDETTEFISGLISTSNEMLAWQERCLKESISEYESNINSMQLSISEYESKLKSMKLMLENVTAHLDKQKTVESSIKLKGLSDMYEVCSLLPKKNCNIEAENVKEDLKIRRKTNSPNGTKQRKNRKSSTAELGADIQGGNDSAENVFIELNQEGDKKMENIENEPPQRRRSARLAIKNGNLSLPVEQSTPAKGKNNSRITQAKSKPCTPSMTTPARNAKWGRRSERPLREYMVLKSAMKFLNTPDSRRYRIGSDEKVKIRDSLDKTDQALVSDKLLKELHDLYDTP